MANDIDELQIQIQASAKGANSSVTALTKRLEKLSNVINGIDAKKVNNLGIGLNNVGRGGNTASAGLNKTSASAKKAATIFNGLASAFGKFYATYFLFIRGAKSVWKGIESSMDYVETSNYFSVALGEIGKQFESAGYETAELYTEALSSELNKLNEKLTGYSVGASGEALFSGDVGLGMDIEQLMNFQAKTLSVTNSVGLMGEASIETAKAVSMLAGDISSLTNTDLETVMTNLSSGLIGQSRSLYKYGYDITQNTLQQYALAEGIDKAVSEMTQSEKMQLRLLAILDQSNVAQTDLANTINSVANQYRVFNQQVDNTGRTLGNLFLPIVQDVLPWVNGLIIALNNLFTSLGFKIYGDTWLEDLQEGISGGAQEGFEDLEGSVDDATDSLNEFKKGVRGFDELNVLTGGNRVGSGVLEELEGQIDLTDSIASAVADYENAWDEAFATAENKANTFAQTLTEMFERTGAVENFVEIVDSIKEFNLAISPFSEGFGSGFVNFFSNVSDITLNAFTDSLGAFSDIAKKTDIETLNAIGSSVGGFTASLIGFNVAVGIESKIAKSIKTILGAIKTNPVAFGAGALVTFSSAVVAYKNALVGLNDEDFEKYSHSLKTQLEELNGVFSTFSTTMSDISLKEEAVTTAIEDYFKLLNDDSIDFEDKKTELQGYVNYITKEFPELSTFVSEHTGLFTANKNEILANIDAITQYAKRVAAQDMLTDAYKEYYESLSEYKGVYQEYVDLYEEYQKKYGNKELGLFSSPKQYKAKEELDDAYFSYMKFQEEMLKSKDKITELEETVEELINSYNPLSEKTEEATASFDELGNAIDELSKKKINIPISIGGGSFNDLDFGRNILTPNLSLKAYAGGGMVTSGEVFVARENGMPELVGNFGGRVGVANNDQIIQGIRQAAYEGFLAAISQSGGSSGVTVVLEGDAAGVFRLVRQEENRNYNRTGNSVFVH